MKKDIALRLGITASRLPSSEAAARTGGPCRRLLLSGRPLLHTPNGTAAGPRGQPAHKASFGGSRSFSSFLLLARPSISSTVASFCSHHNRPSPRQHRPLRQYSSFTSGDEPLGAHNLLPPKEEITLADLEKLDIRVATIVDAQQVPGADKLLKLTLDVGGLPPLRSHNETTTAASSPSPSTTGPATEPTQSTASTTAGEPSLGSTAPSSSPHSTATDTTTTPSATSTAQEVPPPAKSAEPSTPPNPSRTEEEEDEEDEDQKSEKDVSRYRTVFAGIKKAYDPKQLLGLKTLYVANLKPRKMQFGVSEGMVLCASDKEGKKIYLTGVDVGAKSGMSVS
ncbi:Methionine--tRNA ligase [Balamuthia mandrillaris]